MLKDPSYLSLDAYQFQPSLFPILLDPSSHSLPYLAYTAALAPRLIGICAGLNPNDDIVTKPPYITYHQS